MAGTGTPQHPPGQQPIQHFDAILAAAQQSFDQAIADAGFTPVETSGSWTDDKAADRARTKAGMRLIQGGRK